MPDGAVREAHAAGVDASGIATLLGVSLIAAEWRLYNLALSDEPPGSRA